MSREDVPVAVTYGCQLCVPLGGRDAEHWFYQWVAFGMLDMAIYLTSHAAFAAYCTQRDQRAKPTRRTPRL